MDDVMNSPYAKWLEGLIQSILENKPVRIGICAVTDDGLVLTGYYGDCCPEDKYVMAYHIHADAFVDVAKANAREILAAAQEGDEDDAEIT